MFERRLRGQTGADRACILALVLLALAPVAFAADHARADSLPIIIGYETERRALSLRSENSDPQLFWTGQIMTRIEAQRPAQRRPLDRARTAEVSFTIARDGRLVDAHLARGSGLTELDNDALGMVTRAGPFPPMPPRLPDAQLSFTLPVRFR